MGTKAWLRCNVQNANGEPNELELNGGTVGNRLVQIAIAKKQQREQLGFFRRLLLAVRRVRALSAAIGALVLLFPLSTRAELSRIGPSLGAVVGLGTFAQEGHAPPLCCGERDTWRVLGPKVGVRASFGFIEYLGLSLDLRYGLGFGSSNDHGTERENEIRTLDAILAVEGWLPLAPVALKLGLGVGASHVSGEFTRPGEIPSEPSEALLGWYGRVGVELPVLPTLALGIESSFTKHVIVNNELTLGLSVIWYPCLWAKGRGESAAAQQSKRCL